MVSKKKHQNVKIMTLNTSRCRGHLLLWGKMLNVKRLGQYRVTWTGDVAQHLCFQNQDSNNGVEVEGWVDGQTQVKLTEGRHSLCLANQSNHVLLCARINSIIRWIWCIKTRLCSIRYIRRLSTPWTKGTLFIWSGFQIPILHPDLCFSSQTTVESLTQLIIRK